MGEPFYTDEEIKGGYGHLSSDGVSFKCATLDLSTVIIVRDAPKDRGAFALAVAEFAAFHAVHVRPRLNGFRGYDCLTFEFVN